VELRALFIGIVILAGIALYVSRPLLQSKRVTKSSGADASALEAERESLYTQIKELDMDHATGKVNDEDFASQRAVLVAQAAEVLKQIDGLATATPVSPEDEAEALIAARRKSRSDSAATSAAEATPTAVVTQAAVETATVAAKPTTTTKSADAELEAAIAARRKATPVASPSSAKSPVCPKCGKPIKSDDAFCAKCGAALQPQAVH